MAAIERCGCFLLSSSAVNNPALAITFSYARWCYGNFLSISQQNMLTCCHSILLNILNFTPNDFLFFCDIAHADRRDFRFKVEKVVLQTLWRGRYLIFNAI
ncbi:hypothetical protein [Paramixta manurensis]|uniref:hypothetical protein n=1 Tax=Paramixta manurensis TaxID=2740817 RepID=UPI00156AA35F